MSTGRTNLAGIATGAIAFLQNAVSNALGRPPVSRIAAAPMAPASGWIPVEERLPEENVCVLAYEGHRLGYSIGLSRHHAKSGRWFTERGYPHNPTHWQPLPEPPR
jgi:hypothetical protein